MWPAEKKKKYLLCNETRSLWLKSKPTMCKFVNSMNDIPPYNDVRMNVWDKRINLLPFFDKGNADKYFRAHGGADFLPGLFDENQQKTWFCKPVRGSKGTGIVITTDNAVAKQYSVDDDYIVQEAIDCMEYYGHKYDLRIYVVHILLNKKPITLLYPDGLVRLSKETSEGKTSTDPKYLLTNTSQLSTKEKMNIHKFTKQWSKTHMYSDTYDAIKKVMRKIHDIWSSEYFDINLSDDILLVAYDFAIDKHGKAFFLEANSNPMSGLSKDNKKLKFPVFIWKDMYQNIYRPIMQGKIRQECKCRNCPFCQMNISGIS